VEFDLEAGLALGGDDALAALVELQQFLPCVWASVLVMNQASLG
jgi:hypothetical protein